MTSFILSAVCALALSASVVSPQSDTTDLFFVNSHNIVNLDGKELAGKTIKSYTVRRASLGGRPVRAHIITTTDYQEPSVTDRNGVPSLSLREGASVDPLFLELMDVTGSVAEARKNDSPRIIIRSETSSAINSVAFIVDGKVLNSEEFQKLDPRSILSMSVLKDASAETYLEEQKKKGVDYGDLSWATGVVIVMTKDGK